MARYIEVPNPIEMVHPLTGETGEKVAFKTFVVNALLADPAWLRAGAEGAMALGRVFDAVKTLPVPWIALESTDYDKLAAITKMPSDGRYGGFSPLMMAQLRPFLKAILEAKEEAPDKKLESVA